MSKYGFDLDGVLSRPALAQLANDLYDAGHDVYVVTGALADTGEWTLPARRLQLKRYGVRYTEILRVMDPDLGRIGELKGRVCDQFGITVLIDDSLLYLQGAGTVSSVVRLLAL